jgi:hypothetical protein
MRIVIALLLAVSVALALTSPARAESVTISLGSDRLEQITEDSKYICWYALSGPESQVKRRLDSETSKRGYEPRDKFVLAMLCKAYLEGAADVINAQDQASLSRT